MTLLEFLITMLIMVSILHIFTAQQNGFNTEISGKVLEVEEKAKEETVAAYCNLLYFNWENVEIADNINTDVNISNVRCFSPRIDKLGGKITVQGDMQWF